MRLLRRTAVRRLLRRKTGVAGCDAALLGRAGLSRPEVTAKRKAGIRVAIRARLTASTASGSITSPSVSTESMTAAKVRLPSIANSFRQEAMVTKTARRASCLVTAGLVATLGPAEKVGSVVKAVLVVKVNRFRGETRSAGRLAVASAAGVAVVAAADGAERTSAEGASTVPSRAMTHSERSAAEDAPMLRAASSTRRAAMTTASALSTSLCEGSLAPTSLAANSAVVKSVAANSVVANSVAIKGPRSAMRPAGPISTAAADRARTAAGSIAATIQETISSPEARPAVDVDGEAAGVAGDRKAADNR